jgi:signal transduction histidine kinase/DNA-binding response OmpR family regulator/HAMP domain-containing protein
LQNLGQEEYMSAEPALADVLEPEALLEVLRAVKEGNFAARLPAGWTGKAGKVADTLNEVVAMNQRLTQELARLRQVVGKEGRSTQRMSVAAVGGGWAAAVHSVNDLIEDLVRPNNEIARVIAAVAHGDLTQTVPLDTEGEALQGQFARTARTVNTMVDQLSSFASEVTRVAREVGTDGKLGGQAEVQGVGGVWKDLTDNVNLLAGQLTNQIRNIAEVTTAVANGDLSKKVTVDVQGEILELKNTINVMVDQLNSFAGEVTRVAREVGTEGKLGGQAEVPGVSGTWADLTENVNSMAANLTAQVRNIAEVTTAVAKGDLSKKVTVDVQGEILALKNTINVMVDQLSSFASEVTRVAREVGTEGKLGGQASVSGVAGTWRDLTDNVNQLAATLTSQIRAIAEVATAVTEGDLTRSIGVPASGEVAVLKDKLNEMIRNLRETTHRNNEQQWLKTHLARCTSALQGQRDLNEVSKLILSELAPLVDAQHGVFYALDDGEGREPVLRLRAGYAFRPRRGAGTEFRLGEGLVGQCAVEKRRILITEAPPDYVAIGSGLGEGRPLNIVVLPVLFEGRIRAVIELASFNRFEPVHLDFLDQVTESIGVVLNTIESNMRTQRLLEQSQSLASELTAQQEELRHTNEELEQKARLLEEQNAEVERKNLEVEQARRSLEEKAEQLALTSRYKSEFLANMSHELRTPLNSLLILAQQLAENPDGNLTAKQVEFATIIQSSGHDLLTLINDILDLSKIESGTVALETGLVEFSALGEAVEHSFRHVADAKGLEFGVEMEAGLPPRLRTDSKRLRQVLRNLLANAFKFTDRGRVELRMRVARGGWDPEVASLSQADAVVAFDVTDTGIGIPPDKQQVIFEAFQQAEGSASRVYGGTGLGLSISRELAGLLGGQIKLASQPGRGSTFTLFLPLDPPASDAEPAERGGQADPRPEVPDDRGRVGPEDSVVLVVEDDVNFARILLDFARSKGLKGIVALEGGEAVALASRYRPAAVILDTVLRDTTGWKVMEALRSHPGTRGIPTNIVSVFEWEEERARREGAASFLAKPASREALEELFRRIPADAAPEGPPPPAQVGPAGGRGSTTPEGALDALSGHKALVVDDDVRNLFTLTALLERHGMRVVTAEGGDEAIDRLRQERGVDVALVDVMMPQKDGYDTIQEIRQIPELRRLPIIAVTAKAMKGDRQRCLEAGASEYIAKPIDSGELLRMVSEALAAGARNP